MDRLVPISTDLSRTRTEIKSPGRNQLSLELMTLQRPVTGWFAPHGQKRINEHFDPGANPANGVPISPFQ